MPAGNVRVRALIQLLPTVQSGRTAPIIGSYRPNHNFFDAENREMATGLVDVSDGGPLAPGEERLVDIQFVAWPDGIEFTTGRKWRIQEGGRLIGWGTIVSAR